MAASLEYSNGFVDDRPERRSAQFPDLTRLCYCKISIQQGIPMHT